MRMRIATSGSKLLICICLGANSILSAHAQEANGQQAVQKSETQTVRPENLPDGINDSFLDPEMKVQDFIKRFEVESREVFVCRGDIVAALQLEKGTAVADVGAGTGLFLKPLANGVGAEGQVFAIDISPNFVKHLRARIDEEGLENTEVVLCSDRDVNLKPNSVDRVLLCDVYHHFEFPESSLASILRSLRPGGKLIMVDFERIPGKSREWLLGHIRAPKEVFRQEVIDAGFELEEEIAVDGFEENYLLRFRKPKKSS